MRKFEQRFAVHAYRQGESIDRAIASLDADLLYFIKLDRHGFFLSDLVSTMAHEVFPVKPEMFLNKSK